jgi:three-Cys-motif partner protein
LATGDNFFGKQTAPSSVKARIITKHFDTWSSIVLRKAVELGQRIAYMDLYSGPGRYDDGTESTPLLVLEKAIAKPDLAKHLVTIFNDANAKAIEKLEEEVANLPGIDKLKNKPVFLNEQIGPETEKYFLENSTVPSFTFIDPFGYVGLTRGLIKGGHEELGVRLHLLLQLRQHQSSAERWRFHFSHGGDLWLGPGSFA